jgi:hypothetical protein
MAKRDKNSIHNQSGMASKPTRSTHWRHYTLLHMTKVTRIVAVLIALSISGIIIITNASAFALPVCNQTETLTRPIQMGVSGGNIKARTKSGKVISQCCGGTLGSLVVDKKGVDYILSNNHVLARTNKALAGDGIVQPGLEDTTPTLCTQITADTIAKTSKKVTLNFRKGSLNLVDAALAKIVSGDVDTDGDILNIGPISATTDDPPALGQPVQKQGRTTCLTTGTVTAVNVKTGIQYPQVCNGGKGGAANFIKQILVTATPSTVFSLPGDSGSLVVTDNASGCPQAVGLLFAASPDGTMGLVNPIGTVLKKFNVKMVGTCVGPVSAAASSSSASGPADASSTTTNSALSEASAPVVTASAIKDRHESDLLKIQGVIGTGIGAAGQPGKVAIQVYVDHETSQIDSAVPATLEGVPVKVIETGQFTAF